MQAPTVSKTAEIEYPSSDGKPMAETDLHRDWMVTSIERLKRFFRGRRVYVSGNLLIYYQRRAEEAQRQAMEETAARRALEEELARLRSGKKNHNHKWKIAGAGN